MQTQKSDATQMKYSSLSLQVQDDLTVQVIPNVSHEFLMTTKEVANGYGTSPYTILKNKLRLESELIEGKHFITAVSIRNNAWTNCPSDFKLPHNAILWTKRGIIRLGFAMRSERAKLFRDWAEDLIIKLDEHSNLFCNPLPQQKTLPKKRNHNRLTQERMISILSDVCRIENKELRMSITNKLMGGK